MFGGNYFGAALAAVLIGASAPAVGQGAPLPPIEAYGELPALERMALSPSGKIAMLTTTGGKRMLVVLDETMKPLIAMEVGDIKVRQIAWVGDEAIMIERSDTGDMRGIFISDNFEFFNAMIVPLDGQSAVRTVFGDDKSMIKAEFGWAGFRRIDGKWVGYFAGLPLKMGQRGYVFEGGAPTLYAVDMASNKARRIATAPLQDERADWLIDEKGEVAATMTFNGRTGAWRLVDARGRELATGSKPKGGAAVVAFTADGQRLLYRITPDYGDSEYFEVPVAGGGPSMRVYENMEIDSFHVGEGTARLIGYVPEKDNKLGEPVFFDPAAQATLGKVLSAFNSINGTLWDYTPDLKRVLLSTTGNSDSGTWYLADTTVGQSSVIGRSRPLIRPNQVGPISRVTYKAKDGLEIEGILTLPAAKPAKNLPVIVFPHGGPRAHDEAEFDWWAQAFASRGYAVLQPNFRGSTGYGDDFMKAGNSEWGRKMQTDLSDGLAHLAAQGVVDPKRACIMGASYGGYAAMAGITLQQGLYRCSVAVAGVSDLEMMVAQDFRESGSKELRDYWLELMGPRGELGDYSPRRAANKADAPILLIHGRDDSVVPYRQSEAMADALKDAGKPYEMVELREEDHWLSRSATRKQMLEAAMAFVLKHNPPD
jgi:dipeptidyl aminopeptidase/acylaminoacyl peptidase